MNIQDIQQYLEAHQIYACIWEDNDQIVIGIEWGDWKHDHLYCIYLMSEIGYEQVSEELTEEDGSDCYSAEHYFEKQH